MIRHTPARISCTSSSEARPSPLATTSYLSGVLIVYIRDFLYTRIYAYMRICLYGRVFHIRSKRIRIQNFVYVCLRVYVFGTVFLIKFSQNSKMKSVCYVYFALF